MKDIRIDKVGESVIRIDVQSDDTVARSCSALRGVCPFLDSGPVGADDLWYHHIPGTLRFFFSVPPGASHLALGPSKLALRHSQLALRPSQLALRPSQLAPRLTHPA